MGGHAIDMERLFPEFKDPAVVVVSVRPGGIAKVAKNKWVCSLVIDKGEFASMPSMMHRYL